MRAASTFFYFKCATVVDFARPPGPNAGGSEKPAFLYVNEKLERLYVLHTFKGHRKLKSSKRVAFLYPTEKPELLYHSNLFKF